MEFQLLYISELAVILGVQSSAIIINNISPINVRRKLVHSVSNSGIRVIVKGYRMTYTVTVQNTTISALSSAFIASSVPLNAVLVDSGYTSVILGTPSPRYLDFPTMSPTYLSSETRDTETSFPLSIILIIVAIVSAFLVIVVSSLFYREKLWNRAISCQKISFCSIPILSRIAIGRQWCILPWSYNHTHFC